MVCLEADPIPQTLVPSGFQNDLLPTLPPLCTLQAGLFDRSRARQLWCEEQSAD